MKKAVYLLLLIIISSGCSVNKKISTQPNFVAENYFLFGQTALQNNDLKGAIHLFKKAVETDSTNVYLKETLLENLAFSSYYDDTSNLEIIELGEKFIKQKVRSEKIYIILANAYFYQDQHQQAEKYYKKAIKHKPTMANLTGYFAFQQNTSPPGDIKLLKKALKKPWENETIVLNTARLYSEVDSLESVEIFEEIYDKWQNEESLTQLLTAYEKVGENDKVLATIQQHLDDDRPLSDLLKTYLIGRYFTLKMYDKVILNKSICFEVGSHDILKYLFFSSIFNEETQTGIRAGKAIEYSGELTEELAPSFYTYFAELYLQTDEHKSAAECLVKADIINVISSFISSLEIKENLDLQIKLEKLLLYYLEIVENKNKANYALGIFYTELEEKETALNFLNKVKDEFIIENKLNWFSAEAYLQNSTDITKVRSLLESDEERLVTVNESLITLLILAKHDSIAFKITVEEINQNPQPALFIFISYAMVSEQFDTPENMIKHLTKGIELYSEESDLLNSVGYLIADNEIENEYDRAAEFLEKAVALQPESEMIWDSLAWLYYKQNEFEKALEAMKVPLSKEIKNSEISYHIGMIYLALGKKQKAKNYFELTVELNNDKDSIKLSKEILSEY